MRKTIFTGIIIFAGLFWFAAAIGQSKTPSLKLKAFERIIMSGVAPNPVIKVGDEEIAPAITPAPIDYYIYLISRRVRNIVIDQVWIKKESYTARISRVTSKQVILENGKYSDTLVNYTNEAIWQINIQEKDITGIPPKKNIANQVANNELVIRLKDSNGSIYTRTVKKITQLKPFAGM